MIDGLGKVLEGSGQPGVTELRGLLQEVLGGGDAEGRWLDQQELGPRAGRVFRVRFAVGQQTRSLVVKRLKPDSARRNELVAQRWLPAVGLNDCGPPVLGTAAERHGRCVWHVYADLGEHELDPRQPNRTQVNAAVELMARMHTRFAGHGLLGEVRLHGGDLGLRFYESNVRDALYALGAWKPAAPQAELRARLLERLHKLRDEIPRRARVAAEWGGPETLVHGDLWAINVFVIPTTSGWQARLIDWDHAAVGPAGYDLSTFLLRFPPEHRSWVLGLYRQAVSRAGWPWPDEAELNFLFETHEYGRFANRIIWPAIALAVDHADWGFEALAEIEQWFEQFEPVLRGPFASNGPPENSSLGSTGYAPAWPKPLRRGEGQPVPSGNLPDGTGAASINDPSVGSTTTPPAIPVGKLPTGAGRLPAPPILQTGFKTTTSSSISAPENGRTAPERNEERGGPFQRTRKKSIHPSSHGP